MTVLTSTLRNAGAFFAASAFAMITGTTAHAAQAVDHAAYNGLQTVDGIVIERSPYRSLRTPQDARKAWEAFVADAGGTWNAQWLRTEMGSIPTRIWGSGISVPHSVSSAERAESFAWEFLRANLELLAPGSRLGDFRLVTNDLDSSGVGLLGRAAAPMRTVAFVQYAHGLEVLGGQISLRFKNDRLFVIGTEAWPNIPEVKGKDIDDSSAAQTARAWIENSLGSTTEILSVSDAKILPLPGLSQDYATVVEVMVEAYRPRGRWRIFVDAHSGAAVAREQVLKFVDAQLSFDTPVRWPGGERVEVAAPFAFTAIDDVNATTGANGAITLDTPLASGAEAFLEAIPAGDEVAVFNQSGTDAYLERDIVAGESVVWSEADSPGLDAQLTAFISGGKALEAARLVAPDLDFLAQRLQAYVNLTDDVCNAYSDGTTINFYAGGSGCENTARLTDVVYHEFGHSYHAHSILRGAGSFDGALSEGGSDFFAASITGDPGMGRGFFGTSEALRHMDPVGAEAIWPRDIGEEHTTGVIFAGTMWDLRKALAAQFGEADAALYTQWLLFQVFRRAADIPASYVEVLAADDDDGDLSNGTPNTCLVNEVFAAHGLADPSANASVGTHSIDGLSVSLPLADQICADREVARATLQWRWRADSGYQGEGEAVMSLADGSLIADLFDGADLGDQRGVIEYRIDVLDIGGNTVAYPQNPVSPWFETYVGDAEPIYCTNFENNPDLEGWSHELLAGENTEGADDWQWGSPNGLAESGDPSVAYSGEGVYGNDLGGPEYNGLYQADKVNSLNSPVIDISAHEGKRFRIQYRRWLNVEEGIYDTATIYANALGLWQNAANGHHQDREWRFHDVVVPMSALQDTLAVRFEIDSDGGLEMGGWNLDDFCVVAESPRAGEEFPVEEEVPTEMPGQGQDDVEQTSARTDDGQSGSAESEDIPVSGIPLGCAAMDAHNLLTLVGLWGIWMVMLLRRRRGAESQA